MNTCAFRPVIGLTIAAALAFAVLGLQDDAPRSALNWLQFPLLALLAAGLFTSAAENHTQARFLPTVALSWLLGMSVELTLTVDGTGLGGVHPDTVASFVLAQGDYVPLAAAIWVAHRWLGAGLCDLLWIVIGIALTEGLVFTGSILEAIQTGSIGGTVLVACYLVSLYLVYLLLPFRLLGVGRGRRQRNLLLLLLIGFATGFAIRAFWGLVYSPAIGALLGLGA